MPIALKATVVSLFFTTWLTINHIFGKQVSSWSNHACNRMIHLGQRSHRRFVEDDRLLQVQLVYTAQSQSLCLGNTVL